MADVQSTSTTPIESATVEDVIDPGDELYLHHSDHPNFSLAHKLLDGDNCGHWERSVKMSLNVKNKVWFVRGTCKKPTTDSSLHLNENDAIVW